MADLLIVLLVAATGGYGVIVATMYLAQRRLMYPAPPHTADPPEAGVPEMVEVWVRTADGLDLRGWHRAAPSGGPTLVYLHGNAGSLAVCAEKLRPYLDAGLGVLMLAWRGYSGNPGRPYEAGLYADGRAALDLLAGAGVVAGDVVLYGESLGTGIAVHLARERAQAGTPVRALVLEASYASMAEAAQANYPWLPARWLVRDRYDSLAKIAAVGTPTLILHGERDAVVPVGHARLLHAAAPDPRRLLTFANHGHADFDPQSLAAEVLSFLGLQSS